ncbi:MAG: hypothetical protein AAB895_00405 [Patescibacteria group bacterium]|mgnify:FL=1
MQERSIKNWLKENWVFIIVIFIFFILPFILPFFYKYPTKEEYENWRNNLTGEEIEQYIYEQREENEIYAP